MKIAHIAIATPQRCGLYETTHELVSAERALGVDARIVDPKPHKQYHPGPEDRGVPIEPVLWAQAADVVVDHSGIEGEGTKDLEKPIIYVNHGRPASSFHAEVTKGKAPVYGYWFRHNTDERYKAVVTFWPEHVPYLEAVWTKKPVVAIAAPVNLEVWHNGGSGYRFNGKSGAPNVVIADAWRDDVTPMPSVAAFLHFAKQVPEAKLHIYAIPNDKRGTVILRPVQEMGALGEFKTRIKGVSLDDPGLGHIYRAADLAISPNSIYTRSIREPMACGCQVVSGKDVNPENIPAFVEVMKDRLRNPRDTRKEAEMLFDPELAARQFLEVVNG